MSIVVSSGFAEEYCVQAQARLVALGLNSPGDKGDSPLSPIELSQRYESAHGHLLGDNKTKRPSEIGEAWRNTATNLILSNASLAPWGWATPSNLSLLEFWREFEPGCRFLIVYASPADAIARMMAHKQIQGAEQLKHQMNRWRDYYASAIAFCHRHSDVTVLAHHDRTAGDEHFDKLVSDRFNLPNRHVSTDTSISDDTPALLQSVSSLLSRNNQELLTLFQELENTADFPSQGAHQNDFDLAVSALNGYGGLVSVEKLETAQTLLNETRERANNLSSDITEKDKRINELELQIDEEQKAIIALKENFEAQEANLKSRLQKIEALEAEIDDERKKLIAQNEKSDAQTAELDDKNQKIGTLEAEIDAERNALSELRQQRDAQAAELHDKNQRIETLETEINAERNALSELKQQRDAQAAELHDKNQRIETLETEIDTERNALSDLKQQNDAQAAELGDKKNKIGTLEAEIDAERNAFNELKQQRDSQTAELHDKNQKIGTLEAEIDAKKSALSELKQQNDAQAAELHDKNQKIETLLAEIDAEKSALTELKQQNDAQAAELHDKNQKIETLQAEIDAEKSALTELKQQNDAQTAELDDKNQKIEMLQAEIDAERNALSELKQQCDLQVTELDDKNNAIKALEIKWRETSESLTRTEHELLVEQNASDKLNKRFLHLDHAQEATRLEIGEKDSLIGTLQEKIQLTEKVLHQLEQDCAIAHMQLDQTQSENQNYLDKNRDLSKELDLTVSKYQTTQEQLLHSEADREILKAAILDSEQVVSALKLELQQTQIESQHDLDKTRDLSKELDLTASKYQITQEQLLHSEADREILKAAILDAEQVNSALKLELQQTKNALVRAKEDHESSLQKQQISDHVALVDTLEEVELLKLQLHQTQEELERQFNRVIEPPSEGHSTPPSTQSSNFSQSPPSKPTATIIDLRQFIDGQQWHHAEADGRWGGPGLISTVTLPPLASGKYLVETMIVSAMSLDIVENIKIRINGNTVRLSKRILADMKGMTAPLRRLKAAIQKVEAPYPVLISGHLHLNQNDEASKAVLSLEFPRAISPADFGDTDTRRLTAKVKTISLTQL